MSGIIYTATDRAVLVSGHTAGTSYSIDVKCPSFNFILDTPKTTHISIGGRIETVLQRTSEAMSASLIWPHADNNNILEFLYSISAGEVFSFDPYGTIAVPDGAIDVISMNNGFSIGRLEQFGSTPWQSVPLTLRPNI